MSLSIRGIAVLLNAKFTTTSQSPIRSRASAGSEIRPCLHSISLERRKADPETFRAMGTTSMPSTSRSRSETSVPTWPLAPSMATRVMDFASLLCKELRPRESLQDNWKH